MAGRSQNGKFRPDSGKWLFEGETDDLRVLKKNGPLKVSNKEMTNVTGVCESSDSSSVKVPITLCLSGRQHCVHGLTVAPVSKPPRGKNTFLITQSVTVY